VGKSDKSKTDSIVTLGGAPIGGFGKEQACGGIGNPKKRKEREGRHYPKEGGVSPKHGASWKKKWR